MGAGGDPGDKFIDTIMAAYNMDASKEIDDVEEELRQVKSILQEVTDTVTTLHRLDGTTITTTTTTKKITRL